MTLTAWAALHSVSTNTARRWAQTGRLASARKEGRDWHVDEKQQKPAPGKRGPKNKETQP
jgi:predicted site-specific integrase-resolvase